MGPSEAEIEERLAGLRRRREAIDREIADLLLYLELGRRLGAAEGTPGAAHAAPAPDRRSEDPARERESGPHAPIPPDAAGPGPAGTEARAVPLRDAPPGRAPRHPAPAAEELGPVAPVATAPAVAFADDPTGARRYGRALVAAACAVIEQAGRPLHVSAILPPLLAGGFTVPGRDPVAALNTRLWKRSGPGGPLRRMGDATYALAEPRKSAGGSEGAT